MYKPIRAILTAALLIIPGTIWAQTPSHTGHSNVSPAQVSFYSVPLACPAARGLGCGSAAKPVLRTLEKKNTIQEAWLNHVGTTLAIVWKQETNADSRSAEIRSVADDRGISLHELRGEQRDKDLKSFTSGKGWYRGDEVDRLSDEEAAIIADRLIRRAALKAPTITDKTAALKTAITNLIREQLTNCTSAECREDCHKKLVEVARQNLTDQARRNAAAASSRGTPGAKNARMSV